MPFLPAVIQLNDFLLNSSMAALAAGRQSRQFRNNDLSAGSADVFCAFEFES
jgi:hypothetical protein